MNRDKNLLGQRLKSYRKKYNWTQEIAAEKLGISHVYYGELERGSKDPSLNNLYEFCDVFQCTPGALLGIPEIDPPNYFDPDTIQTLKDITSILYQEDPAMIQTYYEIIKILHKKS